MTRPGPATRWPRTCTPTRHGGPRSRSGPAPRPRPSPPRPAAPPRGPRARPWRRPGAGPPWISARAAPSRSSRPTPRGTRGGDPGHRRRGPRHPSARRQREPAPADVRARLPGRGPAAALPRTAMIPRVLLAAAGLLVTLAGVIFALQGVGVIGGSFMSGTTILGRRRPAHRPGRPGPARGRPPTAAAVAAHVLSCQHDRAGPRQAPFARAVPPVPSPASPQRSHLSRTCAARIIVDRYCPPAGSNDPR